MQEEGNTKEENNGDKIRSHEKVNTTLLTILGNAVGSSLHQGSVSAGSETKRCSRCSAARPADTDLKHCSFCGHAFY